MRSRSWNRVVSRAAMGVCLTLCVGVLAGCGQAASAPTAAPGGRGGAPDGRPSVVVAAAVERRDVPVYLEGLGNVAAFYTATVRPQVDGRLDRVLFTEGTTVHRGDVLAQIDPRPFTIALHQAEGVLARDRGLLAANQRILDRDLSLGQQHFVAQQDVDTQRGLVDQYTGAVRADQAAVEAARLNLEYTRITAPIDGVTGIRQVDPGNIVHQSDATGIVVIAQLDPVAVLFTLPEDDLPRVSAQMADGTLGVEVYSRDGDTPLATGQLSLVDNTINQQTATIRLKAVFANPHRTLWPAQFVKVRLLLATRRGALVVPPAAVQRGPQGTFVYVINPDQHVALRPVTVDRAEGDLAIVTQGLSAGESVVVEGQSRLRPGAAVTVHVPDRTSPGAGGAGGAGAGGHGGPGGAGGHGWTGGAGGAGGAGGHRGGHARDGGAP